VILTANNGPLLPSVTTPSLKLVIIPLVLTSILPRSSRYGMSLPSWHLYFHPPTPRVL